MSERGIFLKDRTRPGRIPQLGFHMPQRFKPAWNLFKEIGRHIASHIGVRHREGTREPPLGSRVKPATDDFLQRAGVIFMGLVSPLLCT